MANATTPANKFAAKLADLKANGAKDMATITRTIREASALGMKDELNNILWGDDNGVKLQDSMNEQARQWLTNLHFTKTGKEKANSPFGYREASALANFGTVVWVDVYVQNYEYDTRTPLFNVYEKDGSFGFQYYVGNGIQIVG